MTHDNIVAYEVLADRIKKLGEYRDYLTRLAALSEKLPDEQRGVLLQKVARIADILASEIAQLRAWNLENATKH
ncbi:MAG: hypothetical protein H6985_20010 [Pseudomonadales bacterium]|nr:hypothetical protein [Pseudomonadales bacterium]